VKYHRVADVFIAKGLQEKGQEFLFTQFRLVFLGCLSRLVKKREKMCSWFKYKDQVI